MSALLLRKIIQLWEKALEPQFKEENRVLKPRLSRGRLRLTDTERRRLARLAHPLSRKQLRDTATIATPDTLMRWYNQLIASKFDSSKKRNGPGRPRVDEEIEQLVVRIAQENPTWRYRRIQGALANLGHSIDKITVRNTCAAITSILLPNDASRA